MFSVVSSAIASDGDPVAIRYWPGGGISIESMWNLHVGIGVDAGNRDKLPRTCDVEFVDDFFAASGSDRLVLDRKPNELEVALKPSKEYPNPSNNAIRIARLAVENPTTRKTLYLNAVSVDGVTIIDSNKNSVRDLLATLGDAAAIPKELKSIDAFLIDDAQADQVSYASLRDVLKPRVMVLRSAVPFDRVGDSPVEQVSHNTLVLSMTAPNRSAKWIRLSDVAWSMNPELRDFFEKKEVACKSSQAVFESLTVNQLNFRPSNGTHTPRWNAEHMMGRELLFFSQIYNAVDPSIRIMDLNPKQMPPDYRPAHDDWTGMEESKQMQRVEAFTRRFAYLLDGMELDKKAKGSAFWTPKALLKQMDVHYREHTANVVKKKDLPEWPRD